MYAIKVIWNDGSEEYLKDSSGEPARFRNRNQAKNQVDFMKIGMEGDCQSINVVSYPATKRNLHA